MLAAAMASRSDYIFYAMCVAMAIVMLCLQVNPWWILGATAVLSVARIYLADRVTARSIERAQVRELDEPFLAEVLLDGRPVAMISDRVVTEMFWRNYHISAISLEDEAIIADDRLWEECRFSFRDPNTSRICQTGFAGGTAPFIREGRISLRALYFGSGEKSDEPVEG